jgi:hypothetical protein
MSGYIGFDCSGAYSELQKDDSFKNDLLIIKSELDISKYINPKASLFMQIIKKYYMTYNLNKIKNKMNNVKIDEDKLKDISKKFVDLNTSIKNN